MGLDIYHGRAKRAADESFVRTDLAWKDEFEPLRYYVQVHPNPHIDWEKMFSDRGLAYGNYRLLVHTTDGQYRCFAFVDADTVGFEASTGVAFSDEWQFPLLPKFMQRSNFKNSILMRVRYFFGPFTTIVKSENVIFYDTVGYQRNGVSDEFYERFRPDDATCRKDRVEEIYQATAPELREEFKRNFMDKWIDGRSFVIVSY